MAAAPPVQRLNAYAPADLFAVDNGSLDSVRVDGQRLLRWHINMGQTSTLSMRQDHPLFNRLRYYDRLQLEFRVANGEINSLGWQALGHVSGPRQYKVHQTALAIRTTERGVWHFRELDMARPAWFPWDDPDGYEEGGFFRFDAMAIAPDTVVELRDIRLIRGLIYAKPDYELPVTWPVKTENGDGSVIYTMDFRVLNSSGRPTEIQARVLSRHQRFAVALDRTQAEVRSGKVAEFRLTATMTKRDLGVTEELYGEPLRIAFAPAHEPEANSVWQGRLVRPLSKTVRRQVAIGPDDLELIRQATETDDSEVKKLISADRTIKAADEFLTKRLDAIPGGHNHPGTRRATVPGTDPPRPVQMGEFMPEIVDKETGFREVGTAQAGYAWKRHLGYPGNACENLGMAYLMTGDEKYAEKGVELFRLYARQYKELPWRSLYDPPWDKGPNILCSSRTAGASTYGSNWYFKGHCRLLSMIAESPAFTAEVRDEIYHGFVLPYATEIIKFPGSINNMTDITNHNVLLLGIAFDDAHMVWWATRRDAGVATRLLDIDEDGFSSEGRPLNYHFAAMAEYLPSLLYLERCGLKIDYPKDRLLAAIRMPFLRATLWGAIPNTGDCGRYMRAGPNHLADHLTALFPDEPWLMEVAQGRSLEAKLRRHREGTPLDREAWKKLLTPKPHLFPTAGMAILRSGDTPEEQIQVTLDYGRNVFHAAHDRNQLTLAAFGKMFTHGPGSLYNVGSGGMTRNKDPKLGSFCSHGSLGQNVVLVDTQDQRRAVGKLIAWSDKPDMQVAAARVDGIQPGVSHTRCVVLTKGLVVVFDRLESDEEHTYDFAYHNFGSLSLGEGWTAEPMTEPLATTANYENIVGLQRLSGAGAIRLEWDLTDQEPPSKKKAAETDPNRPLKLALWQLPIEGGQVYVGSTGMNNPNTLTIPDAAPSVFHRVKGKTTEFVTVLEPYRGTRRAIAMTGLGASVVIELAAGERLALDLNEVARRRAGTRPAR